MISAQRATNFFFRSDPARLPSRSTKRGRLASSDNRSWVQSANDEATDFPLANLPFGIFAPSRQDVPRVGVAIGDSIVDVCAAVNAGLLSKSLASKACETSPLNMLMEISSEDRRELREGLTDLLREGSDAARK